MNKEFYEGDYVQVRSSAWFNSSSTDECVGNGDFKIDRADLNSDFKEDAGDKE